MARSPDEAERQARGEQVTGKAMEEAEEEALAARRAAEKLFEEGAGGVQALVSHHRGIGIPARLGPEARIHRRAKGQRGRQEQTTRVWRMGPLEADEVGVVAARDRGHLLDDLEITEEQEVHQVRQDLPLSPRSGGILRR